MGQGTEEPVAVQTAAVIAFDTTGRVLVVTHPRYGTSFPGGHVEAGERPRDAAVRELAEECGVGLVGAIAPFTVTATPGAPSCAWYTGWTTGALIDAEGCQPRYEDRERVTLGFASDQALLAAAWTAVQTVPRRH